MKSIRLALGAALVFTGCSNPTSMRKGTLKIVENNETVVSMSSDDKIRVGIRVEVDAVEIMSEVPFIMENMHTKVTLPKPAGTVRVTAKRIEGDKWRLTIPDGEHYFQVGPNRYRGNLIAIRSGEKVTIANEIGIDDYLKGVLPREAVVSWPDEALKAQAVASRTYLAAHLGKHNAQGFDLCSDVHCQVYGGMTKEHPKTNAAVDGTRGEILIYNNKPIGAYFFAHCGGSTEQIKPVWGNDDQPYLPRKHCPFCRDNPRYMWKLTLHSEDIFKALKAAELIKGTAVQDVTVKKRSGSGRAEIVTVKTDTGSYDMRGNAFRLALNPEKIRSTLWTRLVKRDGGIYEFEGKGWGHGVGLCQWGAKGQAERGKRYTDILAYYYPHADLTHWKR